MAPIDHGRVDDPKIRRFLKKTLPCLQEHFPPERVIAFGSRVKGEALEHSDLDLLVVSHTFEGVRWLDRPVQVALECEGLPGVELLCYSPEEFERKRREWGIVRTAVEEGVELVGPGDG